MWSNCRKRDQIAQRVEEVVTTRYLCTQTHVMQSLQEEPERWAVAPPASAAVFSIPSFQSQAPESVRKEWRQFSSRCSLKGFLFFVAESSFQAQSWLMTEVLSLQSMCLRKWESYNTQRFSEKSECVLFSEGLLFVSSSRHLSLPTPRTFYMPDQTPGQSSKWSLLPKQGQRKHTAFLVVFIQWSTFRLINIGIIKIYHFCWKSILSLYRLHSESVTRVHKWHQYWYSNSKVASKVIRLFFNRVLQSSLDHCGGSILLHNNERRADHLTHFSLSNT